MVSEDVVRKCWDTRSVSPYLGSKIVDLKFSELKPGDSDSLMQFAARLREELLQREEGPPDLMELVKECVDAANDYTKTPLDANDRPLSWQKLDRLLDACKDLEDVIKPPEPEPPKCPWCGGPASVEHVGTNVFVSICDYPECGWHSESFKTEQEALDAARKAGE